FGWVAERGPGVVWHGHDGGTGEVEGQPTPPARSAALGIVRFAHGLLGDLNRQRPPVASLGDDRKITLLARAEIHDFRIRLSKPGQRSAGRGERLEAATPFARLIEQGQLRLFGPPFTVGRIGEINGLVEAVADKKGALAQLWRAVIDGVDFKAVDPVGVAEV